MDVQRRSSERFSTDFYLDHRFSRQFLRFWPDFARKKDEEKLACLSRTARFFQTCDPHETLRMAVKIDVLTFCVFAVFVEKKTKNESKISTLATSPQNLQKVPSGTPFWDPKRTRINFEISKSVPKTKNMRFLAPPGTKPKKGQKKTLKPQSTPTGRSATYPQNLCICLEI